MNIQKSDGTLWPGVEREEFFRLELPALPGVVFLRDLDAGGDVEIHTAPAVVGGPGTFTLRATVSLLPHALKMQTLPKDDVYVMIKPLTSKTEFSLISTSPFHYSRHTP